ncbi:RHS repeat domain-containing protein [Nonomuraea fuscirosea]|uniref:RHS repeat domain-containing protein n=1 Tax=Nonomuraea fuscirosea TaxID=1291556 RepID=UPI0015E73EB8|nr:RHS repeat protein [Nonomuraea fuscirosea]
MTTLGISMVVALPATAAAADRPPGDPAPLSRATDVDGKDLKVPAKPADPVWESRLRGKTEVRWPEAATAEIDVAAATKAARVGDSPVTVRAATPDKSGALSPAKVKVNLWNRAAVESLGARGLVVDLRRTDGKPGKGPVDLELDYAGFRRAYGGDFGARLRVVALPACALTDPAKPECRQQTTVATRNDAKAGKAFARVMAEPEGAVYALDSAPEGQTGDFKATSLSPSMKWAVGNNSGSFSLSYPVTAPKVPGGLVPEFAMSYSSGSVDGRTASTNNQVSWVGEGWDLWSGYVEWRFKGCADDGVTSQYTGDLCWAGDHASIVFDGKASELLYDSGRRLWRLKNDDGSRVEQMSGAANGDRDGQYWRVTTTDGTQYYFGYKPETQSTWTVPVFGNDAGEPCNNTSGFGASWCQQAWRWNLDHVVDRAGNTITYFYNKESNHYGLNMARAKVEYTRGGTLDRAEYGARAGVAATAMVDFDVAERCLTGADCSRHTKESYPDVPYDQECTDATCAGKVSPTFWSTKRLANVTTSIGGRPVESWTLEQGFPLTGDSSDPALWLHKLTRTGHAGGQQTTIPPIEFRSLPEPNRVNTPEDGLLPMQKHRIHTIHNESGGRIEINWAPDDCPASGLPQLKPEENTRRCFPVRWTPPGAETKSDWFRKYVVAEVNADEHVAGGKIEKTFYDYSGGGAWHYNDDPLQKPAHRSWTQWRGYGVVKVRTGDPAAEPGVRQTEKEYRYFRGMHGDRLNPAGGSKSAKVADSTATQHDDFDGLQGFLLEERTLDGVNGPEVSGTLNLPHRVNTATQGSANAYVVKLAKTSGRTTLAAGGVRSTEIGYSYDEQDHTVLEVSDRGDLSKSDDDRCTTTAYAKNPGAWILDLPSQVTTVGATCGTAPTFPRDAISDERIYYDGKALGAAPSAGFATRKEKLKDYVNGEPTYVLDAQTTFDPYGRPLTVTDALGRVSATTYTPQTGPPTAVYTRDPACDTATNPATDPACNTKRTTTMDPAFLEPLSTTDVNGRRTEMTYDGFGRLTAVWKPGRTKGQDSPNVRYTYRIRTDGTSSVATQSLNAALKTQTSYALFDGFLRPRQTQEPAWLQGGLPGRIITDILRDTRGLEVKRNGQYFDGQVASSNLFQLDSGDAQIPSQTVLTYDGAGREIKSELRSQGRSLSDTWVTTTEHRGDHTVVRPPKGGTPTMAFKDARARLTELRQLNTVAGQPGVTTKYAYDKAGRLTTLTDPAGNQWSYRYDVRGRQIEARDPDKGTYTMEYDDGDQLIKRTDARGQSITYRYDKLGREYETSATRTGSATVTTLTKKTYDTVPGARGQLASSTRFAGDQQQPYKTEILGYDAAYNVTEQLLTIPATEPGLAGTYRSKARYSPDGALTWESVPILGGDVGGEEINYTYDDFGKLSGVGNDNNSYVSYTRYTEFGEVEMIRRGAVNNEAWTLKDYTTATRRLSQINVETRKTVGVQQGMSYTHDEEGNVTKLVTTVPGQKIDRQCFGYDFLKRLTQVWTAGSTTADDCRLAAGSTIDGPAPYWTTYDYDQIGNRKGETEHGLAGARDTVRTSAYPATGQPRPHAPLSVTTDGPGGEKTDTYDYYPTGSTKTRPGPGGTAQTVHWDEEDRLASTSAGTSSVYEVDGDRLISRDSAGSTLFLDSGEVRWNKATGQRTGTRYYKHDGEVIGMRTAKAVTWLSQDHNSSDVAAIDAVTLQVVHRRLDPFGKQRGASPAGWPSSRGFVGGITESATGLTKLGVRDYDPSAGKFLSVDPLLDPGTPEHMNAYSYANNTPVTLSDPDGRIPQGPMCPDGECNHRYGPPKRQNNPATGYNPVPPPWKPPPAPRYPINRNKANCADGEAPCRGVLGSKPLVPQPVSRPAPATNCASFDRYELTICRSSSREGDTTIERYTVKTPSGEWWRETRTYPGGGQLICRSSSEHCTAKAPVKVSTDWDCAKEVLDLTGSGAALVIGAAAATSGQPGAVVLGVGGVVGGLATIGGNLIGVNKEC